MLKPGYWTKRYAKLMEPDVLWKKAIFFSSSVRKACPWDRNFLTSSPFFLGHFVDFTLDCHWLKDIKNNRSRDHTTVFMLPSRLNRGLLWKNWEEPSPSQLYFWVKVNMAAAHSGHVNAPIVGTGRCLQIYHTVPKSNKIMLKLLLSSQNEKKSNETKL